MTTPTVIETVRNGNRVGRRVELARYEVSAVNGCYGASAWMAWYALLTAQPVPAAAPCSSNASWSRTATRHCRHSWPTTSYAEFGIGCTMPTLFLCRSWTGRSSTCLDPEVWMSAYSGQVGGRAA
jgi:hypothetical protein